MKGSRKVPMLGPLYGGTTVPASSSQYAARARESWRKSRTYHWASCWWCWAKGWGRTVCSGRSTECTSHCRSRATIHGESSRWQVAIGLQTQGRYMLTRIGSRGRALRMFRRNRSRRSGDLRGWSKTKPSRHQLESRISNTVSLSHWLKRLTQSASVVDVALVIKSSECRR